MRRLQKKIENEDIYKKKYANELSGRENSNLKAYCQTYDHKEAIANCLNNQLSFNMQIFEILEMIQGPWGSYGDSIQL